MISTRLANTLNAAKVFAIGTLWFYTAMYLSARGFSGIEIGMLFSIMLAVQFFSTFPIGVINDRFGIRYAATIGFILEAVYHAGLVFPASFAAMVPIFMLGGLGGNIIDTSMKSMVYKAIEKQRSGRKLGFFNFASSAGSGLGILAGGLLMPLVGFAWVFIGISAACAAMAAVSLFLPGIKVARVRMVEYRRSLFKKSTLLLMLPLFIFGVHWGAEGTSYGLFLRENFGLGMEASGIYMSIPILVLAITSLAAGSRVDRTGKVRKIFIAGFLLSGLGMIMMVFQPVQLSFAFRVVHEIGDAMAGVGYAVAFSKIFRKESVAGDVGGAATFMLMGNVAGSIIFGWAGFAYGFGVPFIISGIITLLASVLLFRPLRGL